MKNYIKMVADSIKYIIFMLKPFWKYGKMYVLITVLCSAILQPLQTFLFTLLPKTAIDAVIKEEPNEKIILKILLFALITATLSAANKVLSTIYSRYINGMIIYKIRNDINHKALYTDFKYYDDPDFYTQFEYAQEYYPGQSSIVSMVIPTLIKNIVTLIAMSSIILTADKVLLLITLVFIIFSSIFDLFTLKPNADYAKKNIEIWKPFHYALRSLKQKENAAELRSSNAGKNLLSMGEVSFKNFNKEYKKFAKKTTPFVFVQGLLSPIQMVLVLAYIVLFIINGDIDKIGLYASLTAATTILSSNLTSVFTNINNLFHTVTHGKEVAQFFKNKSEIEPSITDGLLPPENEFDIELRDISFEYDNSAFSLQQINLVIRSGQRIAIVGENGAGKTTLVKLLLRLYDVSSGEILINGKNIKEYDVHKLRMKIGTAFQNEHILAMTLRENLSIYHSTSDEKLIEIIKKIGLENIYNKSNGLDTSISREFEQDGLILSGGETQRLAIARLFTGKFGLLLLDEPSSALDPLAEANLMKNILDVTNESTTIMVAHRLSTVRDFDLICYMEKGKIIESGNHKELMALKGKYYKMFKTQGEKYQIHNTN